MDDDDGLDLTGLTRRILLFVLPAVAAIALVLFLPALDPVRDRLGDADPVWVAVALVFQLLSLASFVVAFRGAFERRVRWRAATDLASVEAGANIVLPSGGSGGLAIGAIMMVRAGVPTTYAASRTTVLFLMTSAASFAALVVFGTGTALGLLPGDASLPATLGPAAVALVIMVVVVLLPHRIPLVAAREDQRVRHAIRRTQQVLREAVEHSIATVRTGDTLLLSGSIGYLAFDIASLAAAYEALGHGGLPLGTFVLAYVIGHGGAMLPLPGSAEGGLVGAFTAYGAPVSLSVGAVLVYRTFHASVPMIAGIAGYADIRRLREHTDRAEVRERFPEPV